MGILDTAGFALQSLTVTPKAPLAADTVDGLVFFPVPKNTKKSNWCWASVTLSVIDLLARGSFSFSGNIEDDLCALAKNAFSGCSLCSDLKCDQPELVEKAFGRLGIAVSPQTSNPTLKRIKEAVSTSNRPVVLRVKVPPNDTFHYVLLHGYEERESGKHQVILMDPYSILNGEFPLKKLAPPFYKTSVFV